MRRGLYLPIHHLSYSIPTPSPTTTTDSISSSMEVNKEEALRCLNIAQKHRNGSNLPSALKFAKKSVSLYSTPEGNAMVTIVEREISTSSQNGSAPSASASASGTSTPAQGKASGVEEHVTSAHQRPGKSASAGNAEASGSGTKKREYTPKQAEVVKRVKSCQHHEYYKILAGQWSFGIVLG